jgi:hypothetical protein
MHQPGLGWSITEGPSGVAQPEERASPGWRKGMGTNIKRTPDTDSSGLGCQSMNPDRAASRRDSSPDDDGGFETGTGCLESSSFRWETASTSSSEDGSDFILRTRRWKSSSLYDIHISCQPVTTWEQKLEEETSRQSIIFSALLSASSFFSITHSLCRHRYLPP